MSQIGNKVESILPKDSTLFPKKSSNNKTNLFN